MFFYSSTLLLVYSLTRRLIKALVLIYFVSDYKMCLKGVLMNRALISVYDKTGIEVCAAKLQKAGWEIVSTGGTAKFLRDNGVKVREVSEVTGFPEILDGRVKTLHPLIHAPILARRIPEHLGQLDKIKALKIGLVMINFYPFEKALAEKEKGLDFMLENVDVGGPAMVRAAAKNFPDTVVVVDAAEYLPVVERLLADGDMPLAERRRLAQKAFAYTSFYDSLIARYLHEGQAELPPFQGVAGRKALALRYGENPHQKGALYVSDRSSPLSLMEKLQGKELSFNNILDMTAVYEITGEFLSAAPFCVIVKHQNPCGAALGKTQKEAFERALAGDPQSAFGGIVAVNAPLEEETAAAMAPIFFEVILAPDFSPAALEILRKRKNLRLIKAPLGYRETGDLRTVPGGFVFQDRDTSREDPQSFVQKTSRSPSTAENDDVAFGWKIVKFVKSNAIILVRDRTLVGVGAGQMSRVDSVDIAVKKAGEKVSGSVLLSDAFFPFPDSIETAAAHGIRVAVEPGGSVKDEEVVAAAERLGMSLLFTGVRHFRH